VCICATIILVFPDSWEMCLHSHLSWVVICIVIIFHIYHCIILQLMLHLYNPLTLHCVMFWTHMLVKWVVLMLTNSNMHIFFLFPKSPLQVSDIQQFVFEWLTFHIFVWEVLGSNWKQENSMIVLLWVSLVLPGKFKDGNLKLTVPTFLIFFFNSVIL
jgi:hypothetical protein